MGARKMAKIAEKLLAVLAPLTAVGTGALILGCQGILDSNSDAGPRVDPCTPTGAIPAIAGNWEIRGSGTRVGCVEPKFSTDFTLATPQRFRVNATSPDAGSPADGGTAPLALIPFAAETQEGFALTGSARGRCVAFTMRVKSTEGDLSYDFEGGYDSMNALKGKMTGTGPAGCSVQNGSMTVSVQ